MGFLMRRRLLFRDKDPSNSRAGVVPRTGGIRAGGFVVGHLKALRVKNLFVLVLFKVQWIMHLEHPKPLFGHLHHPSQIKKMFAKNYECLT
jgi:hypothetical protein